MSEAAEAGPKNELLSKIEEHLSYWKGKDDKIFNFYVRLRKLVLEISRDIGRIDQLFREGSVNPLTNKVYRHRFLSSERKNLWAILTFMGRSGGNLYNAFVKGENYNVKAINERIRQLRYFMA